MPRFNISDMIVSIDREVPDRSLEDIARTTRMAWGSLEDTVTDAAQRQQELTDRIYADWVTQENLCREISLPNRVVGVSVARPVRDETVLPSWEDMFSDDVYIAPPRYGQVSRRLFDEYSEGDVDLLRRSQEMYYIHDESYREFQSLNFRQEVLDVPRRRNGHDIFNVQDIVLVRGKEKPYVIYKRGDDEGFFVLLPYKGSPWQSSVTRALERGEVTMDEAIHVFHKDRQVKKKFMRKLGHDEIRRFDYHQINPTF